MAITQISNNVILDGSILPAKLNVSANLRTFLGDATSANLAGAVSGTTGSGNLVFATSPTLITPTISRSGNGTIATFGDGSGRTATIETASFGTRIGVNSTGGINGAYVTLTGQLEAWCDVVANTNTTGLRWMRFGNLNNRFSIQRLNDTASAITSTPFSFANNAPTDSFRMESDGRIGFGTTTPNASAIIDLTSTSKGFLPPRMTETERNAITAVPAALTVYNSTVNSISLYNGTAWGEVLTTHAASFTSNTLRNAVSDETGTGNLVFSTNPTFQGANVTGTLAVTDSITIGGVAAAKVVDPVRTTLTGDGTTDTFAISGATGLTNPSALIVAVDGSLQEPGADYSVSGGNIIFTSPLESGAKAVVISPVNTVQVGQVVPSDGSVTSAKIANSVTLTTPSLVGPVDLTSQDASTADRVMNRGLFDFRLFEQAEGLWMFRQGDIIATNVGSGITDSNGGVSLFSGSTANSVSLARIHGGGGTALPMYRLDWSRPLVFSGFILAGATTTNGICRLLLGVPQATTTPVDLTNKGIGIRCVGSAITLVVHNGSTLTTSATVGTLSSTAQYFRIVCDGTGNVELYLNKVLVASTSLGPTGAAVEVGLTASATNNADAAIQRLLCGLFKIWTL